MNRSKQEGDNKRTVLQPEPICMVCFPDERSVFSGRTTYVNNLPKIEPDVRLKRSQQQRLDVRTKEKGEWWLRKRTEARIRKRKRMKEPAKNLKCYLFTSVGNEEESKKAALPSLFEVLETVKDAWPSPPTRNFSYITLKDEKPKETIRNTPKQPEMKNPQTNIQSSAPLVNRRYSMPEELIRKYLVCRERTSEESETNKTTIEISSSSSSVAQQEETARRIDVEGEKSCLETCKSEEVVKTSEKTNFSQQTSESEDRELSTKTTSEKKETLKRLTQKDYYKHGRRFIKVKDTEKSSGACTCRHNKQSSTTASAKEETDDSRTSESLPSSSPFQLPKHDSSSDNLSSESEYVLCTCTELTSSKDTSTDMFHSGKSTLSQTISDKSFSTQDSTVSINSVSTRGSTVTDNSNSTTPEIERTSAKESTTSPDYSPRTPKNNTYRKTRRREKYNSCYMNHKRTCPRYNDKHSKNYLSVNHTKCPVHSAESKLTVNCGTNTDFNTDTQSEIKIEVNDDTTPDQPINSDTLQVETPLRQESENLYKWAKLSQKELYLMQQLRHKKFVESHCQFSTPISIEPDTDTLVFSTCELESGYNDTERVDEPIMIPRYSALPRTLSMIVNTSSGDTSVHNSDSDNQSLVDSLEDQPITHIHKLHFDTKNESKPVRGDVTFKEDPKVTRRQPKGKAFFVSIKDPFGEDEMLENIEKIPQPPDRIKNKLSERRLNVCAKHQHHKTKIKVEQKNKKERVKKEKGANKENEKSTKHKKNNQEEPKKSNQKSRKRQENETEQTKQSETKPKHKEEQTTTKPESLAELKSTGKRKREMKDQKNRFSSKIPILVSSRSTSSSPERDGEGKDKQTTAKPKITLRREKETRVENEDIKTVRETTSQSAVETTQILEITQSDRGLSLQKPQAIIHPSPTPTYESKLGEKDQYTIPSLTSTLKVPPPFRQTLNKQILLGQVRRSPITKFRQRFEVIPEEKSSSLSSAEEKTAKDSLPKFVDVSTSPKLDESSKFDKIQFQSYDISDVPNLIVAKITNQQLETLPYVKNNDGQKIILFSSNNQNSNSSKGRDALIAMNREDFNRLAKGWINFYKLGENSENSDNEENHKESETVKSKPSTNEINVNKPDNSSNQHGETPNRNEPKKDQKPVNSFSLSRNETQNELKCLIDSKRQFTNKMEQVNLSPMDKANSGPKLNEEVRFHSSNTILKDTAGDSIRCEKVQSSLPELRLSSHRGCEYHRCKTSSCDSLPNVFKCLEDEDSSDSDSTDYMEPPSPRVPPLCMADFPSDATLSSSDNEFSDPRPLPHLHSMKYFQVKKRGGTNRSFKENSLDTTRFGKKKNSGWSVTVAGTLELSRSVPDLQMRLSFPAEGGPPLISQSDSGFAEDSNCSKLSESLQDLDFYYAKENHCLGMKNKKAKRSGRISIQDSSELGKHQMKDSCRHTLPDLEPLQSRNAKKVLKDDSHKEEKLKRIIERKIRAIWPQLQEVIKKEFLTESGRLITDLNDDFTDDFCLSVRGRAISLERKKKPLTMTQRDVTRRQTTSDNT